MTPDPMLLQMEPEQQKAGSKGAEKPQSDKYPRPRHEFERGEMISAPNHLPEEKHAHDIHRIDRCSDMEANQREDQDGKYPYAGQPSPRPNIYDHQDDQKENSDNCV